MSMPVTIEWCPLERLSDLMAFIDEVWKPGHILGHNAELVRWQYQHPESKDRLSVLTASDGGKILGMLGVIFHTFNDHGAHLPAAMLATWVARTDQRSSGLGLRLLNTLHKSGVKIIGCLGASHKTTVPICKAYGYGEIDPVPRFVKVFDPQQLAALLGTAASKHRSAAPLPPDAGSSFEVRPWLEGEDEWWNACWHELLAPRLRSFVKDAASLRRRYWEHPVFRYQVLTARDHKGTCQGLVVYRIERIKNRSEKVLHVCELLAAEDAAASALLAAASRHATMEAVCLATCHLTHTKAGEWLQAAGFAREEANAPLAPSLFQPLDLRCHSLNGVWWMADGREPARAMLVDPDFYWVRSDGDQDRPN